MCATDPADGDAIRSESSGASELILRKSQDAEGGKMPADADAH